MDVTAHVINHHPHDAVSITSAGRTPAEEYQTRRRRYAIMMGTRVLCVLAAVLSYQLSLVLALAFMVGGAVLPWYAVLYANERLPQAHRPDPRALPENRPKAIAAPSTTGRVIDL
jgi:hypothetical protein